MTRKSLKASDVQTLVERKLILSILTNRTTAETTLGELEALKHAEGCIDNPVIFLSIVEPWYAAMLAKQKSKGEF